MRIGWNSDDFNLTNSYPWCSYFLVGSYSLSRKFWYQHLHMEHISPDFLDRGFLASNMNVSVPWTPNGYVSCITLKVLLVPTMTWLTATEYRCHIWTWTCSGCRNQNTIRSSFLTYHRVYDKSKTTDVTIEGWNAGPSGGPEFTRVFRVA